MRESHLEVANSKQGWRELAALSEAAVYIGYQVADGIKLPDASALGEQGRLLVRPLGQSHFGYVLYNLSEAMVHYQPHLQRADNPAQPLQYGASVTLSHQDRVTFGDYHLDYFVGDHELAELTIQIVLDDTRLYPYQPLSGEVRVFSPQNQTIQPVLEIFGLPNEVRSGAQVSNPAKGIPLRFQLFHPRSPTPPPGPYPVIFQVKEPTAFRGKFTTRTQTIKVEPYPHHQLYLQPTTLATRRANWMERFFSRVKELFIIMSDFIRGRRSG